MEQRESIALIDGGGTRAEIFNDFGRKQEIADRRRVDNDRVGRELVPQNEKQFDRMREDNRNRGRCSFDGRERLQLGSDE